MATNSPATKDFIRNLEGPNHSRKDDEVGDSDSPGKNQPKSSSESCSEKAPTLHDDLVSGKLPNDADDGESPGIVRRHWIPGFGVVSSRQPSFLEQMLLPRMRKGETSSDDDSGPSQLTIFYAGMVNVYDNVPADKAQAIMLLAGESCLAKSKAAEPQEQTQKGTTINSFDQASLPTIRDLQAGDLPIARKNSLRRFLEKRHDRISNKGPYATGGEDEIADRPMETGGGTGSDGGSRCSSLSPFPSRLGYFCPMPSSNKN